MRFGVIFPTTEIGADPAAVRDYAQAADQLGYDHLIAYDHVLGAHPDRPGGWDGRYTHETMFHEPLVLFGYLAGLTERIRLLTGVMILPQRQTALVAKQVAEVDVLSGGRMMLGVGLGWNQVEYQALGVPFARRAKRLEEQVALLRRLWSEPVVSFDGDFHQVELAGINPLPVRREIPIWIGAMADPAIARAGRIADGWLAGLWSPRVIVEKLEIARSAAREAGRDPAAFGFQMQVDARGTAVERQVELALRCREVGATLLSFGTMDAGFTSPAQHIEAIRAFREALGDDFQT